MNYLCSAWKRVTVDRRKKRDIEREMLPRQQLLRRNSKRFVLGEEDGGLQGAAEGATTPEDAPNNGLLVPPQPRVGLT